MSELATGAAGACRWRRLLHLNADVVEYYQERGTEESGGH